MKLQNPFLLCLILALAIFCHKKDATIPSKDALGKKEYKLVINRGAFHYDKFILTSSKIEYHPDSTAQHDVSKYNEYSETALDSTTVNSFFQEIEKRGFFKLKKHYPTYASCSSELKITFTADGKTKTVICDDYSTYCNDLMKYIDEKVVELEGNDLKRIYLPG